MCGQPPLRTTRPTAPTPPTTNRTFISCSSDSHINLELWSASERFYLQERTEILGTDQLINSHI